MLETLFGGCSTQCGGCCFGLAVILLLCCVLGGGAAYYVYTEGPEPPLSDSFKPSAAEAQAFQNEIDRATIQARDQRWFWFQFSERQLASWMALEGKDFANERGHDFPFENVQAALGDGQITFYGEIQRLGLALPLLTVIEPQINSAGEMTFEITSVDVGGVTLPDAVLRTISRQFEDVLVQPFNDLPGTPVFYEPTLKIENGLFEVQGVIQ
jgi:hypothetical protein